MDIVNISVELGQLKARIELMKAALEQLLQHEDPKVRKIAKAALFQAGFSEDVT